MSRHSRPIHQRTRMQSLVRYGAECECHTSVNLSSRQWRLKPSASKTISTVFHVHNTSATRELSVYLDGQRLRHECHPTYLGVTLDRTLSYKEHLIKTAGKLKNRNNLLMKLAGSTWGASTNTLRSSALVLCYSAAEYCTPVCSRSAHPSQVDVQLNSTMRLISGTLHCTPLSRHVYRFRSVTMAAAKCEMRSILIIIELSYCIIIVIILIYRIVYRSKTVFDM